MRGCTDIVQQSNYNKLKLKLLPAVQFGVASGSAHTGQNNSMTLAVVANEGR